MKHFSVIVVGAGPTGLMLAGELALAGVEVALVERRPTRELVGRRAGGLHSRTLEILDSRGIVDRFLEEGQVAQVTGFAWFRLDISDFPSRYPHGLALQQDRIEEILADWVEGAGVPIHRGIEVLALDQDEEGVTVSLSDGSALCCDYLVGCDGGRSTIRKAAGIDFPGWEPSISNLLAEVRMTEEPELGLRRNRQGIAALNRADDGSIGVLLTEPETGATGEPTLDRLREVLVATYGTDFGVHSPSWISRFTDAARQAATYRKGRVLLAGDSAHIHYPTGGQGLNIGVQDAVNLGWKLGQVVSGVSDSSLLDSYQKERHPVAARVLQNTMAQVALLRTDPQTDALREIMSGVLQMDEPRRQIAAMLSGLDVRYDFGEGHPMLGCRVPDLDLTTEGRSIRLYELLRSGKTLLVLVEEGGSEGAGGQTVQVSNRRLDVVRAGCSGGWELPVVGQVDAPSALLIRPDGHVAWVGKGTDRGVVEALQRWCGLPGEAPDPE